MQKENFRDAEYPRFKVHWSVKLLGWAWVAALVFITGMVIGGMLGFIDEPGEEGAEAEAVSEAAGEAGTVLEAPVYGETLTVEGSGRRFDWISPEHCLLLVGEEGDTYLFNDPLEGRRMAYEKRAGAYEALGSQALAIK